MRKIDKEIISSIDSKKQKSVEEGSLHNYVMPTDCEYRMLKVYIVIGGIALGYAFSQFPINQSK